MAPAHFPLVLRPARIPAGTVGPTEGSAPVAPEQVPGDHQPLDLTGAFINLSDASVTVVPLGWHLCHVAHATQDLHGLRRKGGAQEEKTPTRGEKQDRISRGRGSRHTRCYSTLGTSLAQAPGALTWWVMAVAASDAASLAIAAS